MQKVRLKTKFGGNVKIGFSAKFEILNPGKFCDPIRYLITFLNFYFCNLTLKTFEMSGGCNYFQHQLTPKISISPADDSCDHHPVAGGPDVAPPALKRGLGQLFVFPSNGGEKA